ncbi:hypothetical protein FR483_n248L [Paramecium bursaria Chlorella virus FR483]|uniref:Uncharacterized protein n248L n=1 Tax=Paramecium bursaria Chlorella virus FR483 TaxID=399781 RepID=A7J6V2_PBCVF|nr:hypothetical protein FR483_n248L [Paramecium bursaria Chlorella virus FR483]ABT15533.1 hypothetical protein FR483_n248L [Paramecium bursaria Chlorella virus FR483]
MYPLITSSAMAQPLLVSSMLSPPTLTLLMFLRPMLSQPQTSLCRTPRTPSVSSVMVRYSPTCFTRSLLISRLQASQLLDMLQLQT